MRVILGFFFAVLFDQIAFAGSYSVTLRDFGFNRQNCTHDIEAVAQAFASDANVAITSAGCLPPEIGEVSASGKFTYVGPSSVATSTSDVREAWGLDGYYMSVSACESALQFERDVFTRLTGLDPYVGYCYKANTVSAPRYRVRLDAVGFSPMKKHAVSTTWSSMPVSGAAIVPDVKSIITSLGGEVIAAAAQRGFAGEFVSIDYYHERKIQLRSQELLYWRSAELCRFGANSLNEQWSSNPTKSVFHCTMTPGGKSRLLQIYASDGVTSRFDFETEVYVTAYSSQSACLSDASRIKSLLEGAGVSVLGMTCGQEETLQSWRLAVFSLKQ